MNVPESIVDVCSESACTGGNSREVCWLSRFVPRRSKDESPVPGACAVLGHGVQHLLHQTISPLPSYTPLRYVMHPLVLAGFPAQETKKAPSIIEIRYDRRAGSNDKIAAKIIDFFSRGAVLPRPRLYRIAGRRPDGSLLGRYKTLDHTTHDDAGKPRMAEPSTDTNK